MADINSRLPTTDFSDGATGSATPTEAILVGGTDGTNLRALSVTSTGILNTQAPIQITTGTLTNLSSVVTANLLSTGAINVDISGPGFVGTITIVENTPSAARTLGVFALNGSAIAASITTNGTYRVVGVPVAPSVSVQFTSYTSGSATVTIYASQATYIVQPYSSNAANVLVTSYLNDGSGNSLSSTAGALNTSDNLASIGGTAVTAYNAQLQTADILNTSSQYRAQSITTTAAEALGGTTILANRKFLHITPTNGTIYWGYNSSVTTTTGTPLLANNTLFLSVGPNIHVYVVAAATTDSRIAELS